MYGTQIRSAMPRVLDHHCLCIGAQRIYTMYLYTGAQRIYTMYTYTGAQRIYTMYMYTGVKRRRAMPIYNVYVYRCPNTWRNAARAGRLFRGVAPPCTARPILSVQAAVFYLILFDFILFYLILFYFILFKKTK